MGITHDQLERGAVKRLRATYERLVELSKSNDRHADRAEWDRHCWVFACIATRSDELTGLIGEIAWAFEEGIDDLDDEYERRDAEGIAGGYNVTDPRLGLEVLELVLKAHALFSNSWYGVDQWTNLDGSYDAMRMLEDWNPRGGTEAILYLDAEQYTEWSDTGINPNCWLGFPRKLDTEVPRELVEAALEELAKEQQ